jgi:hypothetical protein
MFSQQQLPELMYSHLIRLRRLIGGVSRSAVTILFSMRTTTTVITTPLDGMVVSSSGTPILST